MEFASNLECDTVSLGLEVVSTTIHENHRRSRLTTSAQQNAGLLALAVRSGVVCRN